MANFNVQALKLHKKFGGKLEIKNKVPLNNKRDLALTYTPGVARVSVEIAKRPAKAYEYTIKKNTVAVVTDGSAILGLGDLGPLAALPVMEGKCILLKEFAGVDAWPICLDTQDTESIIAAVKNIAPGFGGINLEDIAAPRCFEIEKRLQAQLDIPVMHDDQHGTAVVVLGALINALKLKKLKKDLAKIVLSGAGAAGTAIAKLLMAFGFRNLIVCDSQGAIYKQRPKLPDYKKNLARLTNKNGFSGSLGQALKGADVFIGVSVKNLLAPEIVRGMNPKSVVFALANPVPEINPKAAARAGAFIVATGRSDSPNQLNNVLAFPGIFRGALDHRVRHITEKMLINAAENLAASVSMPSPGRILPDPLDRKVVKVVAAAIK